MTILVCILTLDLIGFQAGACVSCLDPQIIQITNRGIIVGTATVLLTILQMSLPVMAHQAGVEAETRDRGRWTLAGRSS